MKVLFSIDEADSAALDKIVAILGGSRSGQIRRFIQETAAELGIEMGERSLEGKKGRPVSRRMTSPQAYVRRRLRKHPTLVTAYVSDPNANGCRFWTGRDSFHVDGTIISPARALWEIEKNDPVLKGEHLERTCGSFGCINPDHYTKVSE